MIETTNELVFTFKVPVNADGLTYDFKQPAKTAEEAKDIVIKNLERAVEALKEHNPG